MSISFIDYIPVDLVVEHFRPIFIIETDLEVFITEVSLL